MYRDNYQCSRRVDLSNLFCQIDDNWYPTVGLVDTAQVLVSTTGVKIDFLSCVGFDIMLEGIDVVWVSGCTCNETDVRQ